MSRRVVRAALAAVALLVGLSALAAPVAAKDGPTTTTAPPKPGTSGAPNTPSGDGAIDDLVGCVQGSRKLLVLFLIDESASLKVTDPDDRRVDAARGALDSLIALASSEGEASPQVQVALSAFSNEYRPVKDWTIVSPDTADGLNESLDQFADYNAGIDTDFVNALSAGRESLADQAATVTEEGGSAPCRAVMLFTDGGYDLAVRTNKEARERLGTTKPYAPGIELTTPENVVKAEAKGRRELCDPGKLADRLRNDDITLLTVALSGDVARRSQYPLAAATTGKADDYTCGTQPKAGESARVHGAYLPAEDIDVVVTQFNGVGSRLAGGNELPGTSTVAICDADPCEKGTRTFDLDPSLRRAQILALAPKPGTEVVIEGPGGGSTTVSKAGSSQVGDTTVSTREVAGRGYAIDLTRPDDLGSWTGSWKVSIVDPSGKQAGDEATLQIYLFSDIGVEFGQVNLLERGATTDFEVVLAVPEGVQAADVVKTAKAQVRLDNPVTGEVVTFPLEGPPTGPFTGTYKTPLDTTANALNATAQIRIETKSNAEIVSQSAPTEVLVRRPVGSIQYIPGTLAMPSLTGEGTTQVELLLLGGKTDGCVWFGKTEVPDAPDGAAPVVMTIDGKPLPGKGDCIKVAKDANDTIVLEATPAGRATGTVGGTIQVFEQVDSQKEASTTEIPFRFDMSRSVDQGKRLLLSLVLLAVGLGLPMLALLLLNALTARFQSLDAVRGTALPVRVSGQSIWRTDDGSMRALTLTDRDFGTLAAAGNDRRFTFGGVEFRARASRNPFGATIAMAAPEGGAEKLKGREGSRVELDPALAGSWIFLLDSDKTLAARSGEVVGLLIAFVADGDVATQTTRMLPDIALRLPRTAGKLAALVRGSKRKAAAKKAPKAAKAVEAEPTDDAPVPDPAPPAEPVDDAPAVEPRATPEPSTDATASDAAADDAPAAPAGFSGTARPVTPPPAPSGGDDEPGGPPIGFSGGGRPDA